MRRLVPIVLGLLFPVVLLWAAFGERAPAAGRAQGRAEVAPAGGPVEKLERSDAEWKRLLTPEQYYILREAGTERPGSSELNHLEEKGVYLCAACGLELFRSEDKYDSGTGWPSFSRPFVLSHLEERQETIFGAAATEVRCSRCGGHLGHVFGDGPAPTGLRYCMNGDALRFAPAAGQ